MLTRKEAWDAIMAARSAAYKRLYPKIIDDALTILEKSGAFKEIDTARGSEHVLYTCKDKNIPDAIKDRNGDIVLSMCRICGKVEAELSEPCLNNSIDQIYEEFKEFVGITDFKTTSRKPYDNATLTAKEVVFIRDLIAAYERDGKHNALKKKSRGKNRN